MKSMVLPKMSTAKPVSTFSKPEQSVCKNLLEQKFNPAKPNLVWVSGITYVRVGNRFAYVCVVIDLFSGKVIAYKAGLKMDTKLVLDTFFCGLHKKVLSKRSYVSLRQRVSIYG